MTKKRKGPKMAKVRPDEQAFIARWSGVKTTPTVWEKMDQDPVYDSAVKTRYDELHPDSLGKSWGRPWSPK
jgi:hypothetical protein